MWEKWPSFLNSAATLAPPRRLAEPERWRYPGLSRLCQALRTRDATLISTNFALTDEQALLKACMLATAHAAALDLPAIAAEASHALEEWKAGRRDVTDVMFALSLADLPVESSRLDTQDKNALVDILEARSDWLSELAVMLLGDLREPELGKAFAERIPEMRPDRRANAAIVSIVNSPNPVASASAVLDSDDPLVRPAAATVAYSLGKGPGSAVWAAILERSLTDPDLIVRAAAGADGTTRDNAVYWSCSACGQANAIKAGRCSKCKLAMHYRHPRRT